ELRDIRGPDGTVGDPTFLEGDFHEGLEPEHSSRAVAHDSNLAATGGRFAHEGIGHLVGADRTRGGVDGHEDHDGSAHEKARGLTSATSSSKRPSSTLPFSRPSTITAGERAQLPRQNTCSSVIAPSAVVA